MYAIKKNTQAYYVVRLMTGEWVSALRVAMGLHIIDMHARIQDIMKADGVLAQRPVTIDGVTHTEYTVSRMPRIEKWSDDARERFNKYELPNKMPHPNAPAWVPPPPFDKMKLAA